MVAPATPHPASRSIVDWMDAAPHHLFLSWLNLASRLAASSQSLRSRGLRQATTALRAKLTPFLYRYRVAASSRRLGAATLPRAAQPEVYVAQPLFAGALRTRFCSS